MTVTKNTPSGIYETALLAWHESNWSTLAALPEEEIRSHVASSWLRAAKAIATIQEGYIANGRDSLVKIAQNDPVTVADVLFSSTEAMLHKCREELEKKPVDADWVDAQLSPSVMTRIPLGEAWSANTVNTVVFRQRAIFSAGGFQYTAFYRDMNEIRILQRNLQTSELTEASIQGTFNLNDSHNAISLGIDRSGRIHMSYDHHGTRIRYRRALHPHNIVEWSDEIPMTGKHEQQVTYPSFILPTASSPLTLLYRDGTWKKGQAHMKVYDEESQSWADNPDPVLSGASQFPWTSNAYWNTPVSGRDGSLQLSFTWRTDYIPGSLEINNIDIGYAKSYDVGVTWYTSNEKPYRLPITQVNSETAWPVAPASNLMNQCGMTLDSQDRPHIGFYADDVDGVPQYQHLWHDGYSWKKTVASGQATDFELGGGGTLRVPLSRPSILCDDEDRALLIYRGDHTGGKLVVAVLEPPNYEFSQCKTVVLYDADTGFYEPLLDYERWQDEGILSFLLIPVSQPDGDVDVRPEFADASIVDVALRLDDSRTKPLMSELSGGLGFPDHTD